MKTRECWSRLDDCSRVPGIQVRGKRRYLIDRRIDISIYKEEMGKLVKIYYTLMYTIVDI